MGTEIAYKADPACNCGGGGCGWLKDVPTTTKTDRNFQFKFSWSFVRNLSFKANYKQL